MVGALVAGERRRRAEEEKEEEERGGARTGRRAAKVEDEAERRVVTIAAKDSRIAAGGVKRGAEAEEEVEPGSAGRRRKGRPPRRLVKVEDPGGGAVRGMMETDASAAADLGGALARPPPSLRVVHFDVEGHPLGPYAVTLRGSSVVEGLPGLLPGGMGRWVKGEAVHDDGDHARTGALKVPPAVEALVRAPGQPRHRVQLS